MKHISKYSSVLCTCVAIVATPAVPVLASVKLDTLFTDNMVLQRDKPVSVWGTATPGERVTLSVGAQKKAAIAGKDGKWTVKLNSMPASFKTSFVVQGKDRVALNNVAVGDVWLCSGQSNMRWPLVSPLSATEDVEGAVAPNVRLLMIPQRVAGEAQSELMDRVEWQPCNPQTAIGFSQVSYYFGLQLQQKLNVPIGLINAACNGSVAQAWMSKGALLKRDDMRQAALQTAISIGPRGRLDERMKTWWGANDPGTKAGWQLPNFDDADWPLMKVGGAWANTSLQNQDGIWWLRQSVDIPAAWAGKDLVFRLGSIDDRDTTFFNGEVIGEGYGWNLPRVYRIPASKVKAGRAVIAIRILDIFEDGGFGGNGQPSLFLAGDATQRITLRADWKCKATTAAKDLTAFPELAEGNPDQPSALYNGMIAPLSRLSLRGVIWYQGESNAGAPEQYRTLFPDLIRDWRTTFGATPDGSEIPFLFVQLANYMAATDEPVQSGWAEIREAQTQALRLPRTAMASAIDIGEGGDIHPRNKKDVGKRLALAALAVEYGEKVEYSGPMFAGLKTEGGQARVSFSHAGGLNTTDGNAPRTFAIRGEDGVWYAAKAVIDGEAIVLSHDKVAAPVAVRYAWANNPAVNLVNAAGLPAVSFRTDGP